MRKVYKNPKDSKIKYIIYSHNSPLKKCVETLDFSILKFKRGRKGFELCWNSVECDLSTTEFIEKIRNKELIQHRDGDVIRKKRIALREEITTLFNNFRDDPGDSLSPYLEICERYHGSSRLVAEEIGKIVTKNNCWNKLYHLERILNVLYNNRSSISYAYSASLAYTSIDMEDRVIMNKESWTRYNMFRELVG